MAFQQGVLSRCSGVLRHHVGHSRHINNILYRHAIAFASIAPRIPKSSFHTSAIRNNEAFKDPYDTLGLKKSATGAEIKKHTTNWQRSTTRISTRNRMLRRNSTIYRTLMKFCQTKRRGSSTINLGPLPSAAAVPLEVPVVVVALPLVPNFMISQDSPVQAARHLAVSILKTCLVLHLVVVAAVAVAQAGRHLCSDNIGATQSRLSIKCLSRTQCLGPRTFS